MAANGPNEAPNGARARLDRRRLAVEGVAVALEAGVGLEAVEEVVEAVISEDKIRTACSVCDCTRPCQERRPSRCMRRRSLARQTLNRCRSIELGGADAGTFPGCTFKNLIALATFRTIRHQAHTLGILCPFVRPLHKSLHPSLHLRLSLYSCCVVSGFPSSISAAVFAGDAAFGFFVTASPSSHVTLNVSTPPSGTASL